MDYAFISTEDDGTKVTVLTCVDVQTGLGLAIAVEAKGFSQCTLQELKKFIHEVGRPNCTTQTDQEPAVKQLAQRLVREMGGMSLGHSPIYHSQPQGSIERYHHTFVQSVTCPKTTCQSEVLCERYAFIANHAFGF